MYKLWLITVLTLALSLTGLSKTGIDSDGEQSIVYGPINYSNNIITNVGNIYVNPGSGLVISGEYRTNWPSTNELASTNWVNEQIGIEKSRATNEEYRIRTDLTNEYNRATNSETVISNWADMTFFGSNESPTMVSGTTWTFANAKVSNTATTDTDAVNYKTGTNLWEETLGPTVGNKELNISFFDSVDGIPYYLFPEKLVYTDIISFMYSGSVEWGTPTSFCLIVGSDDGNPAWNIRLYDVSNAQVIGEYTNFAGTAATILTITNLANIPTNQAIFTLQGTTLSASKNSLRLYTFKMRKLSNARR